VRGEFAYSSDMWLDDMLWGATLRSPHPRARIVGIDITEAIKVSGVHAILTAEDVPGTNRYGLEIADQPCSREGSALPRRAGAIVAAGPSRDRPAGGKKIVVTYDVLPADHRRGHRDRTRHRAGTRAASARQRQRAPTRHVGARRPERDRSDRRARRVRGRHAGPGLPRPGVGLAVPADDGGVELYIATQWLHADQRQVAAALDLPDEKVRFTLAGVGGAFGGREDVSMQAHAACWRYARAVR